jgi:hypothetical protein
MIKIFTKRCFGNCLLLNQVHRLTILTIYDDSLSFANSLSGPPAFFPMDWHVLPLSRWSDAHRLSPTAAVDSGRPEVKPTSLGRPQRVPPASKRFAELLLLSGSAFWVHRQLRKARGTATIAAHFNIERLSVVSCSSERRGRGASR